MNDWSFTYKTYPLFIKLSSCSRAYRRPLCASSETQYGRLHQAGSQSRSLFMSSFFVQRICLKNIRWLLFHFTRTYAQNEDRKFHVSHLESTLKHVIFIRANAAYWKKRVFNLFVPCDMRGDQRIWPRLKQSLFNSIRKVHNISASKEAFKCSVSWYWRHTITSYRNDCRCPCC